MPKSSRACASEITHRSSCPIASALDLFGDRWTLVVVRDLLRGSKYYKDFEASPEGIPTNILADRLRQMEHDGLITRKPYQTNPVRYAYSLTPKGADLKPVLGALGMWAMHHVRGVKPGEKVLAALKK